MYLTEGFAKSCLHELQSECFICSHEATQHIGTRLVREKASSSERETRIGKSEQRVKGKWEETVIMEKLLFFFIDKACKQVV